MKKIIFNQNTFKEFFSPVGPFHTFHDEHVWPYDYVDRNSNTLLVTIGDSWTWGSGICGVYNDAVKITKEQNNFRVDHLYGNLISKEKNWNWLNLAVYSGGNQWIADKVFELRRLTPSLQFKNIIVVCVLTSTARWLNTWQDSLTDYKDFFEKNKMTDTADFEIFLINLNKKILSQIKLLTKSADNIRLLIGTNMVDHCGFDVLEQKEIIPMPWYKLLSRTNLNGIFIDTESLKYLPFLENVLANSDQKTAFQKWMIEKIDQAEKQYIMLRQMDHISYDTYHPDHHGHRKWADYIIKDII